MNIKLSLSAWLLVLFAPVYQTSIAAVAGVRPDHVFVADAKKSKSYIGEGVIVGGDWAIDNVTISGIRRAANAGYERIVVDLDGNHGGEPVAVDRPPYYHVAVSPQSKRVVVTIMGTPKLAFDAKKVAASFKKSTIVEKVELLPLVEKDRWAFVLHLKQPGAVEVFELNKPTRIILDLQASKAKHKAQVADMINEN